MKKCIPILIILLLASPLLAEELTTEGTEQTPEKPTVKSTVITILTSSIFFSFITLYAGGILLRGEIIRRIRQGRKTTPQEIKIRRTCICEFIIASTVASIITAAVLLWILPSGWLLLLLQLTITSIIYEAIAVKVNIPKFRQKGIFHEALANTWKAIKSSF